MEKVKINNWEQLLKLMTGSWFIVDEVRLRITGYKKYPKEIEIQTNTRPYTYNFDEIKTAFYNFKPIEHEGVPAFDIMGNAEFEGSGAVSLYISSTLKPKENVNDGLISLMAITQHQHHQQNEKLINSMDKVLDELDKGGVPSIHLVKKAEIISQFSKDITNIQLAEIKSLALLQKAVEMKGKNPEQLNNTNENSSNNQKD